MTGRLIVVGDSFCELPKSGDSFENWCQQAARVLEMPLLMSAGPGVSQDWQWDQLQTMFEHITPQDRVLVVITHCERQWFVEDQPAYTHVNVANLPEELGVEMAEAIRHYCVHLQRPNLDLQHQAHRLGWLHAQVDRVGAHPIWVLPGFRLHWIIQAVSTSTPEYWDHFRLRGLKNLLLSDQNLYDDVQEREMQKGETTSTVFQGVDLRYNHLLRHNHKILAECVVRAIRNKQPVDLRDPRWMCERLSPKIWQDTRFIQDQMNMTGFQRREEILQRHSGTLLDKAWYKDWFKK